jgi:murein DD-endopeptidase MepM/ murein hydrolase activator NlpD
LEKRAINRYRLPVPKNLLERIDRTSSPAHAGNLRNAMDFIVPENTPVLAAAIGLVTYVKDDPIYWNLQILLQSGMRMKNIQGTIIRHLKAQKSKYANLSARTNSWRDFDSISV